MTGGAANALTYFLGSGSGRSLRFARCWPARRRIKNEHTVIHSTSREVLLDMVVRDKHHHAVTDLRQEEVEIYEDGVRQNIRAFHNVQGAEQLQAERTGREERSVHLPPVTSETAPSLNSLRQINFVSVVLAQIAPQGS